MATKTVPIYNAANFPYKHVITSTDQTDGSVTIDFQLTDRDIVWSVKLTDTNGAVKALTGALITEPTEGAIKIANGGSFTATATDILYIQGMAYDADATIEDI